MVTTRAASHTGDACVAQPTKEQQSTTKPQLEEYQRQLDELRKTVDRLRKQNEILVTQLSKVT